jgi:hypothetical protein
VSVEDSVAAPRPIDGEALRDSYFVELPALTLGVIRARNDSLWLGSLELLRFGRPKVGPRSVEWPITGGLLAALPGGSWRIESEDGRLTASVEGYRPMLPRPLYALTQLHVHHLLTRLYLLKVRGREPAPGRRAFPDDRMRAAAIDVAFCATMVGLLGRRRRPRVWLGVAIGYHLACWTISGRSLGGLVMRQRVIAVDGSRLSPTQSFVRLMALPFSWVLRRPVHDELAGTDVVEG